MAAASSPGSTSRSQTNERLSSDLGNFGGDARNCNRHERRSSARQTGLETPIHESGRLAEPEPSEAHHQIELGREVDQRRNTPTMTLGSSDLRSWKP